MENISVLYYTTNIKKMGCACTKSSAVEDSRGDSSNDRFTSSRRLSSSLQKALRLESSRRHEDFKISSQRLARRLYFDDNKVSLHGTKFQGPNRVHDDRSRNRSLETVVKKNEHLLTGMVMPEKKKLETVAIDHRGKGSVPKTLEGEQVAAGWPTWLSAVAGEALKGWLPRPADTFEKLEKIGQGTYSSVYRARDMIHDKIVALKRVRFDKLDVESIKFMAREILILRKLDHPNVIKLEGLITAPRSCSLYLVFEYMEHDLTGLATNPNINLTEPQVKCFMQQLLRGLDYCHSHGVLHRDIKGSNLLINNEGILKIADFGLASFFDPHMSNQLTSRVVTLWYRPPELLLGDSRYGIAVDLWSAGCILAELYTGKPILPGKTEVEQLHKIFKLCGSPTEDYWRKLESPHSKAFKPAQPYSRCVMETFKDLPAEVIGLVDALLSIDPACRGTAATALKNKLFTTKPLACTPSSLPKYPPSKEIDTKMREEGSGRPENVGTKDMKAKMEGKLAKESQASLVTKDHAEFRMSMPRKHGQATSKRISGLFNPPGEEPVSGFLVFPTKQPRAPKELSNRANLKTYHPISTEIERALQSH